MTLVVLPVYNHPDTLRKVAESVLDKGLPLLVVDDGSTPPVRPLLRGLDAEVLRLEPNQGKGAAILAAADRARTGGHGHVITMDADGQHSAKDLPRFLDMIARHPRAVIVGARDFSGPNVPGSSRFGRAFSNFWLRLQTGQRLADSQSGFRAYPTSLLTGLSFREKRYAFEIEVLAKAAWAGFELVDVPVSVHYPPKSERISHFRTFRDNLRISLLNTRLTARSFLPVPHRKYDMEEAGDISPIHPLRSLKILLAHEATPRQLALSAALGVLLGTLPLIGAHNLAIVAVSGWFRLNKIAALASGHLCIPPVVPALCVEAGHYLLHGRFLTELSWQTLGYEAPQRLAEWILGTLVLGPVLAVLTGLATWLAALAVRAGMARRRHG